MCKWLWHTNRDANWLISGTPVRRRRPEAQKSAGGARLRLVRLFPHLAGLCVERVVELDDVIYVEVRRAAATARCPQCGRRSRRVHSRYTRRLMDEPVGRAMMI